jgi:hypothetical protein
MQQAIEGLPLSYLMSVALRQVYDAFLIAYEYAQDTACDELRSESLMPVRSRDPSMSPGSCGAVFMDCDDIIIPEQAITGGAPLKYDVRKLLSTYSRHILDESSNIEFLSRQHASQVRRMNFNFDVETLIDNLPNN